MEYDEKEHKNFLFDHFLWREKNYDAIYEILKFLENVIQNHILLKYLDLVKRNHILTILFLSQQKFFL